MKRIIGLILSVIMIFSFFSVSVAQTTTAKTAPTTNKNYSVSYPLKVKDANGVEITIKKEPVKIISLTLATDEIIMSMVDAKRITALSTTSDDNGISNISIAAKKIKNKLGSSDIEKIISLKPDLVFVASWAKADFVKQLRDAGINVYGYSTPSDIKGIKQLVTDMGMLLNTKAKAIQIIAGMDATLSAINAKVKNKKDYEKPVVLYCDSFWCTYGKGTTFDEIAKAAGVINAASQAGITGIAQISKEKIIEMNPDVIILPAWSYQGFDAKDFAKNFKQDPSFQGLNALFNNKIVMVSDAHMTSVSQYITLAVSDIAKLAYPDSFIAK